MTEQSPKVERDIWLGYFERIKQKFINQGMSEEDADERAEIEIRKEIRNS